MNYELAKELKDAGFPQPSGNTDGEKIRGFWYTTAHQIVLNVFDLEDPTPTYDPALSELIGACPENHKIGEWFDGDFTLQFYGLTNIKWHAGYEHCDGWYEGAEGDGSTPEEAVAKLWLALNKPSHS